MSGVRRERERERSTSLPPGPTPPPPPFLPPSPLQRYSSLTCGALAVEGVDLVDTLAVVQAGADGALVRIDLAELSLVTWPISKGRTRREMDWLERDTVRIIFTLML